MTYADQLELFPTPAGAAPPPEPECVFLPACHLCGATGEPIPVHAGQEPMVGDASSWRAGAMWAVLSITAHMREMHPEHARPVP